MGVFLRMIEYEDSSLIQRSARKTDQTEPDVAPDVAFPLDIRAHGPLQDLVAQHIRSGFGRDQSSIHGTSSPPLELPDMTVVAADKGYEALVVCPGRGVWWGSGVAPATVLGVQRLDDGGRGEKRAALGERGGTGGGAEVVERSSNGDLQGDFWVVEERVEESDQAACVFDGLGKPNNWTVGIGSGGCGRERAVFGEEEGLLVWCYGEDEDQGVDWAGDAADGGWGGEESRVEGVDVVEGEATRETESVGERGHHLRVVLFGELAEKLGEGDDNSIPRGMKTLRSSAMVSDFSLSKETQRWQLEVVEKCR